MRSQRFWEIDFLRGIAIVMMILFHSLFDLNFFNKLSINVGSGFWLVFARITAGIFIFLVGISMVLSYEKSLKQNKANFKKYLLKGLKIFGYGLLITIITYLFLREGFVVFGILHFIGISIILSYFFLKLKKYNLFLGIFILILGFYLNKFAFNFNWLLWLGFIPNNLYTVDYFPLLPWFGLVLIGLFFGNLLYKEGKRNFNLNIKENLLTRFFCFLGRNSLLIYLIHQPILVGLVYLI